MGNFPSDLFEEVKRNAVVVECVLPSGNGKGPGNARGKTLVALVAGGSSSTVAASSADKCGSKSAAICDLAPAAGAPCLCRPLPDVLVGGSGFMSEFTKKKPRLGGSMYFTLFAQRVVRDGEITHSTATHYFVKFPLRCSPIEDTIFIIR